MCITSVVRNSAPTIQRSIQIYLESGRPQTHRVRFQGSTHLEVSSVPNTWIFFCVQPFHQPVSMMSYQVSKIKVLYSVGEPKTKNDNYIIQLHEKTV